jgi:hypothetical protein
MDKKDEKMDKESCESDGCCSRRHCCSGKAALVLVLLLIGGLIGYGVGRHSSRWGCHYGMADCPMMGGAQAPTSK